MGLGAAGEVAGGTTTALSSFVGCSLWLERLVSSSANLYISSSLLPSWLRKATSTRVSGRVVATWLKHWNVFLEEFEL